MAKIINLDNFRDVAKPEEQIHLEPQFAITLELQGHFSDEESDLEIESLYFIEDAGFVSLNNEEDAVYLDAEQVIIQYADNSETVLHFSQAAERIQAHDQRALTAFSDLIRDRTAFIEYEIEQRLQEDKVLKFTPPTGPK